MRRLCWCVIALLAVISFTLLLVPKLTPYKWLLVTGESVKAHFGLLAPGVPETLALGDYVALVWQGEDPNHIERLKPGTGLVKRVGCLPGQHLRVTAKEVDCDGKILGLVREFSLSGKRLAPALFDGIIPQGLVFLVGDHPASYDGRYFGLVPMGNLRGKLLVFV